MTFGPLFRSQHGLADVHSVASIPHSQGCQSHQPRKCSLAQRCHKLGGSLEAFSVQGKKASPDDVEDSVRDDWWYEGSTDLPRRWACPCLNHLHHNFIYYCSALHNCEYTRCYLHLIASRIFICYPAQFSFFKPVFLKTAVYLEPADTGVGGLPTWGVSNRNHTARAVSCESILREMLPQSLRSAKVALTV